MGRTETGNDTRQIQTCIKAGSQDLAIVSAPDGTPTDHLQSVF